MLGSFDSGLSWLNANSSAALRCYRCLQSGQLHIATQSGPATLWRAYNCDALCVTVRSKCARVVFQNIVATLRNKIVLKRKLLFLVTRSAVGQNETARTVGRAFEPTAKTCGYSVKKHQLLCSSLNKRL